MMIITRTIIMIIIIIVNQIKRYKRKSLIDSCKHILDKFNLRCVMF